MADGPLRIAVSGYYGCGNTGDEAVLAGIVESFARRGLGRAEFTILSQDPADTEMRHGLPAVERMSLSVVRSAIRSSNLLISGGGSLLQDTTSVRSLVYYLWVVRMGLNAHVPVMFYAQGIGPLRRKVSRFLTRIVANRAAAITVRDPGSAELLRRIGVNRPPIEVTADPAFALTAAMPERVEDIRVRAGVELGRPAIGMSLRPWHADNAPSPKVLAEICDRIVERTGGQIVFIPMQPPGDMTTSTETAVAMKHGDAARIVQEPLLPREALGLIGSLDGLMAMRLHALIFAAASASVPIVALSYDPKVTQLMEGLDTGPYNIPLDALNPERAARLVSDALDKGTAITAAIGRRSAEMAERALRNVDVALGVAR